MLGELYGRFILTDEVSATVGAHGVDTLHIGRFDVRMTPNTFEAAYLQGLPRRPRQCARVALQCVTLTKRRYGDSDDFVSTATVAGAPPGVSRGVAVAGGIYVVSTLAGAPEYHEGRTSSTSRATEVAGRVRAHRSASLKLAAQYLNQRSVGDNLLTGHEFSTEQFGQAPELAFAARC